MALKRLYRVMVFDNNSGSYDRLKKLAVWNESGFELTGRTSDMKALNDVCVSRKAELVLCFSRQPLINAENVITAVKSADADIVCIAAGARDDFENMRKCFIAGAIDYLTEPISDARLKEVLTRAAEQIGQNFMTGEYASALQEYLDSVECADSKFKERLTEFLMGCENTIVTTEYAADHFGFNKDYFGRMFKQKTGLTFGGLYKRFRMVYAEKLLASGRYKVYEVSSMLGFSSVDYFTSVFKKTTGRTPSEIKK
ncbi:response regulator transcription factor [uncultured Ruminococcus sp.]|uniref:response regulator transcription factor n=1 Tax=uncultured Ruminococcus sp. TaxID=165186 RepID=UPI0025F306A2|nr:response regulator transcription factor [uncultured Ruminococcus sp.]